MGATLDNPGATRRPSPQRRRSFALALSLGLHAAALTLLLIPATGRAPPTQAPIELELIEPPAEPTEPVPLPVPVPEAEPGAESSPPGRPSRRAERRPPSRPAPAEDGPAAPSGADQPLADGAPEPGGLAMRPRLPPSLLMDRNTVERFTRDGVIAPADVDVAVAVAESAKPRRASTFSERLAERVRRDAGRQNVADGKVHPQLYEYMRDARKLFVPDPESLDRDPRSPNTVARSFRQWARGGGQMYRSWRRELERGARRSSGDDDRRGAPDVLDGYNRLMDGTARAAETMDCLICLVVRPGQPAEVVLDGSSGNAEVDRAAIDALTRAANRVNVERDVRPQKSCYRFSASVHRIPPVPIVGCGFDEASLTAGCYYPTMKVRKTSVVLESVDYDG